MKFCETIGFDYVGAIIWQKVTTTITTGGATIMGSFPYPRNGILKIDFEFILIFKKQSSPPKISKDVKEKSKLTREEWNQFFTGLWNFPEEKQEKHLTMFPEKLPRRLIKMFSFVGDRVLDPFLGSGTTAVTARNLERNSIGYGINKNFLPIIKQKIKYHEASFLHTLQVIDRTNLKERIQQLPSIFKDPIKFDQKVDPKKLQFGSKIDKNHLNREEYLTVKEIISTNELILNNDLRIKLLGIKEKPKKQEEVITLLKEKIRGNKVFLKFNHTRYDHENNLVCYLYLANKTFLNAHLIKQGLVEVDTSFDYKYKNSFLSK